MAFPALGLTKTVWAVDVLIECIVFGHDKLPSEAEGEWHDMGVTDGRRAVELVERGGRAVFVSRDGDKWRTFDAKCADHDATVECPLHGWRFDATNGDCIRFGLKGLQEFETKVSEARSFAWC